MANLFEGPLSKRQEKLASPKLPRKSLIPKRIKTWVMVGLGLFEFASHSGIIQANADPQDSNANKSITTPDRGNAESKPEKNVGIPNWPVAKEIWDEAQKDGEYFDVPPQAIMAILVIEGGGSVPEDAYGGPGATLTKDAQLALLNNDWKVTSPALLPQHSDGSVGPGQLTDYAWEHFGKAFNIMNPTESVDTQKNQQNFVIDRHNLRKVMPAIAFEIKTDALVMQDLEKFKNLPEAQYAEKMTTISDYWYGLAGTHSQKIRETPVDSSGLHPYRITPYRRDLITSVVN